jgi:beta-galactosidase
VTLELTGPARLLGLGNGNVNDTASCRSNQHKTFQGRALAFLQSTSEPGEIVVKASAAGLEPGVLRLSR